MTGSQKIAGMILLLLLLAVVLTVVGALAWFFGSMVHDGIKANGRAYSLWAFGIPATIGMLLAILAGVSVGWAIVIVLAVAVPCFCFIMMLSG